MRPHRRQPTRLPRPWDSPGKNTGVGCHFLLQCMKVKSESEAAQSCPTPSDPMDRSLPGSSVHLCYPMDCRLPCSSVHGDSPGKNIGGCCHDLLHGIFPTQGLNPGVPHCRQILYHLSHQGSPRKLEWVAYPFSRGSSQPRD